MGSPIDSWEGAAAYFTGAGGASPVNEVIEAETLPAMLEAEVGLLAREKMILEYVRDSQDRQKHLRLGPTGQMFLN